MLEKLKEESPQSLVIILTAYGGHNDYIKKACDADVYDFIDKPVDNKVLLHKIRKAFQHADALLKNDHVKKEILLKYPYENMIGDSPKMKEIFRVIEKIGPTDKL